MTEIYRSEQLILSPFTEKRKENSENLTGFVAAVEYCLALCRHLQVPFRSKVSGTNHHQLEKSENTRAPISFIIMPVLNEYSVCYPIPGSMKFQLISFEDVYKTLMAV